MGYNDFLKNGKNLISFDFFWCQFDGLRIRLTVVLVVVVGVVVGLGVVGLGVVVVVVVD